MTWRGLRIRVVKNVVRRFSLVHDPEGSHYENADEAKLNRLMMTFEVRLPGFGTQ